MKEKLQLTPHTEIERNKVISMNNGRSIKWKM